MFAIMRCLDFDKKNNDGHEKFLAKNSSLYDMTRYFIDFFNGHHKENYRKKKLSKKQERFLLCLDNVEKIIESEREEFLSFLEELYEECEGL